MSDIFDNAIDSLEFGVSHFLTEESRSRKFAILIVYQAIELLLKERLHQEHPILIYRHLDRKINDDSQTVGLDETLERFANLGVALSSDEVKNLKSFRRRRNQIQHHRYEPTRSDVTVIGQALKFVYNFLPDHLDRSLDEHLEDEPFRQLREMIHDYDELLAEAEQQASELTGASFSDDPDRMTPTVCPECGTRTLVIGTDRGNFCFLCRHEYNMDQCDMCGEYVSSDELEDSPICAQCWDTRSKVE